MNRITIDILNPKAFKLLQDLADLDLISIKKTSTSDLSEILKKLRSKSSSVPDLDEITKEVETVRSKRYGSK